MVLGDSPAALRVVLDPYVPQLTIKLLHVRRTTAEVPSNFGNTLKEALELAENGKNSDGLLRFSWKEEFNIGMGLLELVEWAFGT